MASQEGDQAQPPGKLPVTLIRGGGGGGVTIMKTAVEKYKNNERKKKNNALIIKRKNVGKYNYDRELNRRKKIKVKEMERKF